VEVLIQHLRSSQDQGLSAVICAALGRTGAESALVALRELLGASPRDAVWLSAAAALAQAGQVEGTEALASVIESPDPRLRAEAAERLGSLGPEHAGAWLKLLDDPDASVRAAAAAKLEGIQGIDPTSLSRYASHADAGVRRAAARALREAEHSGLTIGALVSLLDDPDQPVVEAALEALVAAGGEALEALSAEARAPQATRRRVACRALARFGPHATDTLVALAQDAPPDTAAECLRALGVAGDPGARTAVLQRLADPEAGVRAAALGALRHLAAEADAEQLVAALGDPHDGVRTVAAVTIASVMTAAIRQRVLNALSDASPVRRAAAAQALLLDGHQSSIPALNRATESEPEPWVAALMTLAADVITRQEHGDGNQGARAGGQA